MASTNYRDTYARSLEQREDFWLEAVTGSVMDQAARGRPG